MDNSLKKLIHQSKKRETKQFNWKGLDSEEMAYSSVETDCLGLDSNSAAP